MFALFATAALAAETYPFTDPELLAIRRIESEAIHLALKKSGKARARYARTAVEARLQRIDGLSPAVVSAEREVERSGIGSGGTFDKLWPAEDAGPRALAAGAAMATLLDDLKPGWRDDGRPLDVLLDEATSGERTIPLSDDINGARTETEQLRQTFTSEQTGYLTSPGYSLNIEYPLIETSSDPFAAIGLDDGTRLHRKNVELAGPAGTLSVKGPGAWVSTDEVRVAGLTLDQLLLTHEGNEMVVTGPGVELRLKGAVYSGSPTGMTIQVVPGASMDADPAVFALFSLATATGYEGKDLELRDDLSKRGVLCKDEVAQFEALVELDHPWLGGMLAQTVLLSGPPSFEPDRETSGMALDHQKDGRFSSLPELLSSYWACARLERVWDEHKQAWIDAGQDTLIRSAGALAAARDMHGADWPHVRIVPNPLDRQTRGFSASHGDEVSVFLGPPPGRKLPPDPAIVVHEALHHVVDAEVRGGTCEAFDAVYETVAERPTIAEGYPDAKVWLAENLVRALAVELGAVPGGEKASDATSAWVEQGFVLVPGILAGLERETWDVWLTEQCLPGSEFEPDF